MTLLESSVIYSKDYYLLIVNKYVSFREKHHPSFADVSNVTIRIFEERKFIYAVLVAYNGHKENLIFVFSVDPL